jgi:hypothetical protein
MKQLAAALMASTTCLSACGVGDQLKHAWVFNVQDLQHKPVASLKVRFTDQIAPSCRGGTWKRVIVESFVPAENAVFPGADALSYRLEGQTLTIGRNEICDAYIGIIGQLIGDHMTGDYYSLGEAGTSPLGYAEGKAE